MANRVNVNIHANDFSRRGLDSLRRSMDRVRRDAQRTGGDIRFNIRVDPGTSRRELRRLQRMMRGQPVTITTRLDPPTPAPLTMRRRIARILGRGATVPVRLSARGLRATVMGPLRSLRGLVSGTLQDGIGQGIIQGFQAGGPIGASILLAAIVAALSIAGAALSGLLITVLGAAFVGVGGVSAAMSKEVQSQWSKTLVSLKENFREVGEPMIPVLTRAIKMIEDMADRATPKLKKAIEDTVPATNKFIDGLFEGFERFGDAAFQPIMDAWNVFAPVFGESWSSFMDELGHSFKEMADLVREHPTEIAMALNIVFGAIDLLVDTVTFLGKVWVFTMQNMFNAVGVVLSGIRFLVRAGLDAFGAILLGAKTFVDFIPGLKGSLDGAAERFFAFRDSTLSSLDTMTSAAFNWDDALNRANRRRQLEADISSWTHNLERARAELKKTTDQKAKAKLEADIRALEVNINNARTMLNGLNGKTATTYINTIHNDYYNAYGTGPGGVPGKAHGGIGRAATGGARSNMTLVGEQGPELVNLAPGSRVRSNPDTRRLLAGQGGGGGQPMQVNVTLDGRVLASVLVDPLRNEIRDRGGNVQDALGQRGR